MKNFYIETYGCQMNVSDSELVASILMGAGYNQADNLDDADIIIFNTCSVRQHAEDRVMGRISAEMRRKKEKQLLIGVIGCMAQRVGQELGELNSGIDFVAGTDAYARLPQVIEEAQNGFCADTLVDNHEVYQQLYPVRQGAFNAFVTIMRGCNNFCSYCIVPYTRGRERSRPMQEILTEVDQAGKVGFKDVTLLGQNVNSYTWQGVDFSDLLAKAAQIDSIQRLRFVTSHPKDLSDSLIQAMASQPKVCHHIHLPMQSGSDTVLARMGRRYTSAHYLGLIEKLRRAMPDIAITTDVIVGFPGETGADFAQTLDVMRTVEFDFAFMFKYSEREGTKAANFEDQIPGETRLRRLEELIAMQSEITNRVYQRQVGQVKQVYVEQVSKKSDSEMAGKSDDFKIVVFPGGGELIGSFVKVKITKATGWTLKGELV